MRVNMSNIPSPPKEYVINLPKLDGGLNLWDLDYRMKDNQSPEMKNVCWLDGALGCRDGQVWVSEALLGTGYACYAQLFCENAVMHIGGKLYVTDTVHPLMVEIGTGIPENRGTFFRYGDALYYKNVGGYFKISYNVTDKKFSVAPVVPYSPVILINAVPASCAGDEYQPENRICAQKTVWYTTVSGVKVYKLPVSDIGSVDKVIVDGVTLEKTTGYTEDLKTGTVTFVTEPTFHNPIVPNTVKITFSKNNTDATESIMDCPYAEVFGGNQNVCVVVGGCKKQPNAYYWCGNHTAMDPGYFPFSQYNFAGNTEEAITGFGKQQSMLVIFKERSIGRATFGTTTMLNGRVMLEMPYTAINSKCGCDLPWTIQLIENNLVFCNTSQGVHFIRDSSSAHENNIVCISKNVNGGDRSDGLLSAVRTSKVVASCDDDKRYWIVTGGNAYVWDYVLSGDAEPSWFYYTNILGIAFFKTENGLFHMNADGKLTMFKRTYMDYGLPIEKVYRFATQNLGSYDRLKDVNSVLFSVRSDTDTKVAITYETDYEERADLSPIISFSWKMVPRNLAYRFLGIRKYATVARRKPGCRHIRHFSMRLTNNEAGNDLSIVSAQIFYCYQGSER